jgi:hypothetical protein
MTKFRIELPSGSDGCILQVTEHIDCDEVYSFILGIILLTLQRESSQDWAGPPKPVKLQEVLQND